MSKSRLKRYTKETAQLTKSSTGKEMEENGVSVTADQDASGNESKFCWHVKMVGPEKYMVNGEERDCPYAGRTVSLEIHFEEKYPFKPPTAVFKPPLYHPNVEQTGAEAGHLCGDFVKSFWAPTKKAIAFVFHIRNLLAAPDLDTALAEDIAAQIRENVSAFEKKVAEVHKA